MTRGSTFVSPSNESRSVVLPHPTGPITAVIPLCLKLHVPDRMNDAPLILCRLVLLPSLSPLLVESPICIFTSSGRSQVAWTIKRHASHDARRTAHNSHHMSHTTQFTPHVTRHTSHAPHIARYPHRIFRRTCTIIQSAPSTAQFLDGHPNTP